MKTNVNGIIFVDQVFTYINQKPFAQYILPC